MYSTIPQCRICGNRQLTEVLDLGSQILSGVFPSRADQAVSSGPLRLVKCDSSGGCGLLQLQHTYDLSELYGLNYGYRSGLNASMVQHLQEKVRRIVRRVPLGRGDLVVDIGSNDSTTLQAYPNCGCTLVGVDPTGVKFRSYYPEHIELIADFFSAACIRQRFGDRKAAVITSFSMFYDLEDPLQFMREVAGLLDRNGIWVFEQSYMPTMLARNSYDTVCHEHLEYYALKQIQWMADQAGLRLLDVEFNDVNGGSFSVVAARTDAEHTQGESIQRVLEEEALRGLDTLDPYIAFAARTRTSRDSLREFLATARAKGQRVCALGASTKGNVILQYCGVTAREIECVGEVNEDKFGCFTPGTLIPIVAESELHARNPDRLLVLPWHFRSFFQTNGRFPGRQLVFPLPTLETVTAQ
jgi:NDP-4-keto-2,6-dideoxyhexose 3-C-methyltransferase